MADKNTIDVKIVGPYVSCVGILCLTISVPKLEPEVYEIIGVSENGNWLVKQII